MEATIVKTIDIATKSHASNKLAVAVMLALIGYLGVALMNVSGKALTDIPISILVFFQFFVGFLFSVPGALRSGVSGLKTQNTGLILLRAASGLFNVSAIFLALHYIPLVNAVVLQNTAPLFLPLLLWFVLRKSVPKCTWIALIIGFIGVLLIVKPSANAAYFGILIGLGAGFLSSVSMISVTLLKQKGEASSQISFYLFLLGTIATLPLVIMHHEIIHHLDFHHCLLLIVLGFLTYTAQTIMTHAFAHHSTHVLGALSYSTVLFSGLLGWAIWHHAPDWISAIGIILVALGGILAIVWR